MEDDQLGPILHVPALKRVAGCCAVKGATKYCRWLSGSATVRNSHAQIKDNAFYTWIKIESKCTGAHTRARVSFYQVSVKLSIYPQQPNI